MATAATERKNGNSTMARHNGTTERQNGNGMVETRHKCYLSNSRKVSHYTTFKSNGSKKITTVKKELFTFFSTSFSNSLIFSSPSRTFNFHVFTSWADDRFSSSCEEWDTGLWLPLSWSLPACCCCCSADNSNSRTRIRNFSLVSLSYTKQIAKVFCTASVNRRLNWTSDIMLYLLRNRYVYIQCDYSNITDVFRLE